MDLPSYESLVRRAELISNRIEAFAAERNDEPLAWCHMPRFGSFAARHMLDRPYGIPGALAGTRVQRMRQAQLSRRALKPLPADSCAIGAGCLFLASGPNMRRSQAALHRRFGPFHCPEPEVDSPLAPAEALASRAVSLAGELVSSLRAQQLEVPIDSASIYRQLLKTARLLGYWERVLAREAPRAVVVGTVASPRARTLIHAARQAGIATVYIPHVPLTHDVLSVGLPVDHAGLRGIEEADHLARGGADRERLDVVGNPTIPPDPPPEIDPSLPYVFASPPGVRRQVAPLVDVILEAVGGSVVVSHHPTEAPDGGGSTFPAGWRIWEGRTYDLLRAGGPVVIQHSSGVALEALHLGIGVIELRHPGQDPRYPLIREPYVRFASGSHALREAIAAAAQDAQDPSRRERLVGWARRWASPTGTEAEERAVSLVERAMRSGPRGSIWDPWLSQGPSSAA